ncbi:hypothetical protein [Candidatus Thiosymbion oneisti]|uniref:hypothetical protein n=1 Tax=Candidatus Thiosymbion oneisti TaxID=589554 RepID=UPI00114CC3F8|nr:hypothetical protein [Candidatus Thiosymbion oneisti]
MKVTQGILEHIRDPETFNRVVVEHADEIYQSCLLVPVFSRARASDAYTAWENDVRRVAEFDLGGKPLDHLKQAAHLAYWLRRMGPIIDSRDSSKNIQDGAGYVDLTKDQETLRELLFKYSTEYLAFDLGYQICAFYEKAKAGASGRNQNFAPTTEYVDTVCHFLKFKNISPHALFLIYKSLFLERF